MSKTKTNAAATKPIFLFIPFIAPYFHSIKSRPQSRAASGYEENYN